MNLIEYSNFNIYNQNSIKIIQILKNIKEELISIKGDLDNKEIISNNDINKIMTYYYQIRVFFKYLKDMILIDTKIFENDIILNNYINSVLKNGFQYQGNIKENYESNLEFLSYYLQYFY